MVLNLRELISQHGNQGRVEMIVLRPIKKGEPIAVNEATAIPGQGLIGDHRAQTVRTTEVATKREITLLQYEHLPLIAAWTADNDVNPLRLRRNLIVSGLNLIATHSPFPNQQMIWRIGNDVLIEVTGTCPPCSRMETELGKGGYSALRGHGGMTARLIVGGQIKVGDNVVLDNILEIQQTI